MPFDSDETWSDDPPSAEPPPRTARPFGDPDDRYELGELIGQGGLGRVVSVHDLLLDREVARKELRVDRPLLRERFVREARITARLDHPNIVTVHDAGQDGSGRPFYTMPRLEGRTLAEVLADELDPSQRLALLDRLVQVCHAVAYAHDHGLVHRDLKPANLVLGARGEVWVVDWGLATEIGDPVTGVSGTPGWMSPQQERAEPPDPRDDVWALGLLLRELSAGDAPRELRAITDKAVHPDPAQRYPDAGALTEDLERFRAGRWVGAYEYSAWEVARRWLWRRRVPVAIGLVSLVVIAGSLIVNEARVRRERDEALTAREQAEAALAFALEEQARRAVGDGDLLEAEILAAEALMHRELPEARGILMRTASAWYPELIGAFPTPFPCVRGLEIVGSRVLCVGSEGAIVLQDGAPIWQLEANLTGGALSPDGATVALAVDRATLRLQPVAGGPAREVPADGIYAVGWTDRPLWGGLARVGSTGDIAPIPCNSTVSDLAPAGGGAVLVSCVNGMVFEHQPGPEAATRTVSETRSVTYAVHAAADGRWFGDHRSLVGLPPGQPAVRVELGGYPTGIASSPDGEWLAVGTDDGGVSIVDLRRDLEVTAMPAHSSPARVAFGDDGTLWTSGPEGLRRWRLPPRRWTTLSGVRLVPSPDGRQLALASQEGGVRILDASTGLGPQVRAPDGGSAVPFWNGGRWMAAVGGLEIEALHLDGAPPDTVARLERYVGWVSVADGALAATTVRPDAVIALDPDTFEVLATRLGQVGDEGEPWIQDGGTLSFLEPGRLEPRVSMAQDEAVSAAALSPGRRRALLAGQQDVFEADVATGRRVALPAHPARVVDLAYLTDDLAVTASWDGLARVFALGPSPREVAVLRHGARILDLQLVGSELVIGTWDQEITRFDPGWLDARATDVVDEIRARTGYGYEDGEVRFLGQNPRIGLPPVMPATGPRYRRGR